MPLFRRAYQTTSLGRYFVILTLVPSGTNGALRNEVTSLFCFKPANSMHKRSVAKFASRIVGTPTFPARHAHRNQWA